MVTTTDKFSSFETILLRFSNQVNKIKAKSNDIAKNETKLKLPLLIFPPFTSFDVEAVGIFVGADIRDDG